MTPHLIQRMTLESLLTSGELLCCAVGLSSMNDYRDAEDNSLKYTK